MESLTGTVVPLTNTVFGTVWLDVSELFRSILAAATTGSLPATLGILWFHRCASGTRFIMMFEMGVSSGSNVVLCNLVSLVFVLVHKSPT